MKRQLSLTDVALTFLATLGLLVNFWLLNNFPNKLNELMIISIICLQISLIGTLNKLLNFFKRK